MERNALARWQCCACSYLSIYTSDHTNLTSPGFYQGDQGPSSICCPSSPSSHLNNITLATSSYADNLEDVPDLKVFAVYCHNRHTFLQYVHGRIAY